MTVKKTFSILLFALSFTIAVGLVGGDNMWGWIVIYWATLTVKNATEV